MGNYRSKLRGIGCLELEVNSVKRKSPEDKPVAKNINKTKKAEVNDLPPHPAGETDETLERERVELLGEVQIRDNHNIVSAKMARTFSYRRQDVIQALPVKDFKDSWPALFEPIQIKEDLRRITTVALESTFIQKLDKYTPKLLDLFKTKGGAVKEDMQKILEVLYGCNTSQESVIRGLIIYLGERVEELITEYKVKVFIFVSLFISKLDLPSLSSQVAQLI
ncbi:uncharacterized protein LOC110519961 [Oncorhynchus mykiss]|uniref:uncharacterized protein LOC110519961 n=1 Tax=Oncorhynchus mykiss TaxID=8022 RepID=UPI001878CB51|nr:uncharacterized protein LOC110519961 [Oncorhynchus mykiss]